MTNVEVRMTKEIPMSNDQSGVRAIRFDLEERTARFGEAIVRFAKRIPLTPITEPLLKQLVRAGTSVGSNYCEADDAGSKKEFRYRISVCKRESRETKYWLRMIAAAAPDLKGDARVQWQETKELNLIFGAIHRNGSDRKAGAPQKKPR